ncbi:GIY-YIG nuclease family protein [Gemmatimonas sp.]|uniref:GIY-YIG nuclease family protein n=1 Tax=Gemmatimonas sp. TaxID=1962908 RepID=UPI00356655E5
MAAVHALLAPARLYTRAEVLSRPSPVPPDSGVYAWYFQSAPLGVPLTNVHRYDGHSLLYVGISPSRPPSNGKAPSQQHLRKRLRYHFRGNAEGSTLRLTLGILLATEIGIQLARVGRGTCRTFAGGEQRLSEWMAVQARVCWMPHPTPWEEEERLIAELDVPLNLAGNRHHPFAAQLSALRSAAKAQANLLEVVQVPTSAPH